MTMVMLHEIGHAIGVRKSYNINNDRWGIQDGLFGSYYLTKWDSYLVDDQGDGDSAKPVAYPTTNSFSITGNIKFDGTSAVQAYGRRLPIYSPNPFEDGSSLAHIDPRIELQAFPVMLKAIDSPNLGLYDFEVGMFRDIGWTFVTPAEVHSHGRPAFGQWDTNDWHNGGAWNEGLPPEATSAVYLDAPVQSAYIIRVSKDVSAASVEIASPAILDVRGGILSVSGEVRNDGQIDINASSGLAIASGIYVGHSGSGTLNIEAGGQVNNYDGHIGHSSGSTGAATVTGNSSRWANSGDLHVGEDGNGSLRVEAGGQVSNAYGSVGYNSGSIGAVTVTGEGSTWTSNKWLFVGDSGSGDLSVEAGGQVTCNWDGWIGFYDGASGSATVTGPGSAWRSNGYLIVGFIGSGTLRVDAEGRVDNTWGLVGNETGSVGRVTINGTGSVWTNTLLCVGGKGTGYLTVSAGGHVTSESTEIALWSDSSGSVVTVTGAGSTWTNTGYIHVGNEGSGTLVVEVGGTVSTGGSLKVGGVNTGLLALSGGTIDGSGAMEITTGTGTMSGFGAIEVPVTNNGTLRASGGTLILSKAISGSGSVTIDPGAVLSSSEGGTISGTVTNSGALRASGGALLLASFTSGSGSVTIDPGAVLSSSGVGTISGLVTNNGTLRAAGGVLTLDNAVSGSGSVVVEAGTLTLSGANTYSGNTAVNAGTLRVTGSIDSSAVTVSNAETVLAGGGSVKALTVNANAIVAPGNSVGTLDVVAGNVTLNSGAIYEWDFGGGTLGDLVDITGGLTLGASWKLKLVDAGGTPAIGSKYDLFAYTTTFSGNVAGDIIASPATWPTSRIFQDGPAKKIYVQFGRLGDTNDDFVVDAVDYIALKHNLGMGSGALLAQGDLNQDGAVNWADLQILMNAFGTVGGASATTPEPATLWLLALGGLTLIRRRRK